jgi:hypothetical protein
MSDSVAETQPPPPEKVNSFARIVGVFFSPNETFQSIARKPDFAIPLTILAFISLVSGWVLASRLDFVSMMRETMEANPQTAQMPAERLDSTVKMMAGVTKAITYASPLLSILVLVILAGIIFLAFRMFEGQGDFKQAFSATVYAWYPALLKGVIAFVVLLNRKNISMIDLQNPVRSNLAFLVNPKTRPVMFALLSSFDLFSIWLVVLLIIGFAALSRLSKARSAAIVITLWIIGTLLKLIGPAFQAMRMKS